MGKHKSKSSTSRTAFKHGWNGRNVSTFVEEAWAYFQKHEKDSYEAQKLCVYNHMDRDIAVEFMGIAKTYEKAAKTNGEEYVMFELFEKLKAKYKSMDKSFTSYDLKSLAKKQLKHPDALDLYFRKFERKSALLDVALPEDQKIEIFLSGLPTKLALKWRFDMTVRDATTSKMKKEFQWAKLTKVVGDLAEKLEENKLSLEEYAEVAESESRKPSKKSKSSSSSKSHKRRSKYDSSDESSESSSDSSDSDSSDSPSSRSGSDGETLLNKALEEFSISRKEMQAFMQEVRNLVKNQGRG
ncbi:hypothetical protein HDU99_009245, partial [Rhizoclosmatium hyalinum]